MALTTASPATAQYFKRIFNVPTFLEQERGNAMAIDKDGNTLITGSFMDNINLDPLQKATPLTSSGGNDIFIAKYNNQGILLWAVSFGGDDDDDGKAIALDASGNVYITGYVGDAIVDFDPSTKTVSYPALGGKDIFVSKFSSSGVHQWSTRMGGLYDEEGNGVALDKSSNVYTVGYFRSSDADFNTKGTPSLLTPVGLDDVFFTKHTTAGSYQWAGSVGSNLPDVATCISVDKNSYLYIGGYFQGQNVEFNPATTGYSIDSYGGEDAFVLKLTPSGGYQWVIGVGGTSNDRCKAICFDSTGNFYITGSFRSSNADFNPSGGTKRHTPSGFEDAFVAKYKPTGGFLNSFAFGGNLSDNCTSIASDKNGSIYITGFFTGENVDFDPGVGTRRLSAALGQDCYIAKYTSAGVLDWCYNLEATNSSEGTAIGIDKQLNLSVMGKFGGNAKFDSENSSFITQSDQDLQDIFLLSLLGAKVGVSDIPATQQLSCYPNPAHEKITISGINSAHSSATIIDALGIRRKTLELNSRTVDIMDLTSGAYSIIINDDTNTNSINFIKY
ncbi:MAG TPA: T9SS type A sorting domain-containing protein [Candidatus Kapabacteria bacterium]